MPILIENFIVKIKLFIADVIWSKKIGFFNFLFLPFSGLYYVISLYKRYSSIIFKKSTKLKDVYVICIGNVTVGGNGKTIVAISLVKYLLTTFPDLKIAVISKGYGRITKNKVTKVDAKKHTALEVGDEALLLAEFVPTYIADEYDLAALNAKKDGANIIIMDDGMQNYSLAKDMTIMVVDKNQLFGNGLFIPAGPLRETVRDGLSKSDYVIFIQNGSLIDKNKVNHIIKKLRKSRDVKKIYEAEIILKNKAEIIKSIQNRKYVYTLSGIANPAKFLFFVEEIMSKNKSKIKIKSKIKKNYIFPDHYNYTSAFINTLVKELELNDGCVITTTKDFARLGRFYF